MSRKRLYSCTRAPLIAALPQECGLHIASFSFSVILCLLALYQVCIYLRVSSSGRRATVTTYNMTKNELEEFFKAKSLRGKFHRLDDKVDE